MDQQQSQSLKRSFGIGVSSLLATGIAEGITHGSQSVLLIGAIATIVAVKQGPDGIDSAMRFFSHHGVSLPRLGGRNISDRLMGRFPDDISDTEEFSQPEPQAELVKQRAQEEASGPEPLFPLYPEDETLFLGTVLKTCQRLDPHVNSIFGKGGILSAVQGSGKSMLCGLIIEQAAQAGVPTIVLDHKGEYSAITELPFTRGLRAGAASLRSKVKGSFFELTADPKKCDEFVELVMSKRYQAIVHLPSYGEQWVSRAEIVGEVGQALMRRSARIREAGGTLLPCLVFLDEAQLYIPQNVQLLPPEAGKNRDVLDSLSNAYFALVSNGRSNGYTMFFATQSLTFIAKWAIKSAQIRVFMRHVEYRDLKMCSEIIDPSVATREQIETMPAGVGVVFGFTTKPLVVHFDTRVSRDDSKTPDLADLRQTQYVDELYGRISDQLPNVDENASFGDIFETMGISFDIDEDEEDSEQEEEPVTQNIPSQGEANREKVSTTLSGIMEKLGEDDFLALLQSLSNNRLSKKEDTGESKTSMEPLQFRSPKPTTEEALLERGVQAYLAGHTSQPALAAAVGLNPTQVRIFQKQVMAEVARREAEQVEV